MASDIRLAILGTGFMAQTMAAAIGHVPGLSVAGFASRDPERARKLGMALRVGRHFGTLDDLLEDPSVDGVYIANETSAHAAAALRAIEAGKPVLCEKPFAMNAAEAHAVVEAAARTRTLFMEAVATPFLPAVAEALTKAKSGALGELRQLNAEFGYLATRQSHPGCYAPVGGGVLLDRAVYLVTLALLALGPAERAEAIVKRDGDGIDTHASLLLTHEKGGIAMLAASFDAELGNRMTIAGSDGLASIEAPLLSAEVLSLRGAGSPSRPVPATGLRAVLRQSGLARRAADVVRARHQRRFSLGASPYIHELSHFRDLIRSGAHESPVLPPSLSARVIGILDSVRTQAS